MYLAWERKRTVHTNICLRKWETVKCTSKSISETRISVWIGMLHNLLCTSFIVTESKQFHSMRMCRLLNVFVLSSVTLLANKRDTSKYWICMRVCVRGVCVLFAVSADRFVKRVMYLSMYTCVYGCVCLTEREVSPNCDDADDVWRAAPLSSVCVR